MPLQPPPPVGRRGSPPIVAVPRGRDRRPLFCVMGGGILNPADTDVLLLTVPARPGLQGVVLSMGNEIEPDATTGAYYWDDGTRLTGVWFTVKVGRSAIDDLGYLNSPWGFIGDRGKIWLPFNGMESVQVYATSAAATPHPVDMCVQLEGAYYTAGEEI